MDRRSFLQALAAAGASLAAPALAGDEYFEGFRAQSARQPWLKAYQGLDSDLASGPLRVEGRIPEGLRGTLYRNGPALFERGGVRYRHLFDGDGMVQAYRFAGDGVHHRGRFVRTRRFATESASGRFMLPAFGTAIPVQVKGQVLPDDMNAANTSVVAHGGRLLALWEGGSAYELDPATLETRGPVTWRADLKGAPFSAHPKVETDGTMWNVGATLNTLVFYRIDRNGALVQAHMAKVPGVFMNHDFAVSQNHLVCVLPAVSFNLDKARAGSSTIDAIDVREGAAMRVLVVEKADLSKQRWFEIPAGFMFHFGNAWEERGALRFDYVHYEDPTAWRTELQAVMRGDVAAIRGAPARSTHVAIDLERGTVRTETLGDNVEFPRVDPRFVARRNRQLWHGAQDRAAGTPMLNAVLRNDLESGKRDLYSYGDGCIVEEHIVVPDPASSREGGGWLVGCAFDTRSLRTSVNVFDALALSAGPVARVHLPYGIPPGFHGDFVRS